MFKNGKVPVEIWGNTRVTSGDTRVTSGKTLVSNRGGSGVVLALPGSCRVVSGDASEIEDAKGVDSVIGEACAIIFGTLNGSGKGNCSTGENSFSIPDTCGSVPLFDGSLRALLLRLSIENDITTCFLQNCSKTLQHIHLDVAHTVLVYDFTLHDRIGQVYEAQRRTIGLSHSWVYMTGLVPVMLIPVMLAANCSLLLQLPAILDCLPVPL